MVIPHKPARGMTLIEVLVASLILGIGIAGMLALQTRALTQVVISGHRQQASLLLQELAELIYISPDAFSDADAMSLFAGDEAPVTACPISTVCPAHLFIHAELSAWRQAASRRLPGADVDIQQRWQQGYQLWTVILRWYGPEDFSQNTMQAELLI